MKKGILIYYREDYEKNVWFANKIMEDAKKHNMLIRLVLTEEILVGINENGLYSHFADDNDDDFDFVINRSRDTIIAKHFELMGYKVFNSSLVTDISNNKAKTHQLVNSLGIKSVNTLLCNKKSINFNAINLKFPIVLKSVCGHGGKAVFQVKDINELKNKLSDIENDEFILQEMCATPGIDIRVYIIGNKITAAVKRFSENNFKANYSLGGQSELFILSDREKRTVNKITETMNFDFVGIDFILDEKYNFLFNEIEDVVGTRTLYNHNVDIVENYLEYVRKILG